MEDKGFIILSPITNLQGDTALVSPYFCYGEKTYFKEGEEAQAKPTADPFFVFKRLEDVPQYQNCFVFSCMYEPKSSHFIPTLTPLWLVFCCYPALHLKEGKVVLAKKIKILEKVR